MTGLAIYAPNCSGKSTFLQTHPGMHMYDGDTLPGVPPPSDTEWTEEELKQYDQAVEIACTAGLNVLISAFWDRRPDIFVVIPAKQHQAYAAKRGGDWPTIARHAAARALHYRSTLWSSIPPLFTSFEEVCVVYNITAPKICR